MYKSILSYDHLCQEINLTLCILIIFTSLLARVHMEASIEKTTIP